MRTQKILITLGMILVFAVSSSVWAETQNFKGTIKLGYRVLDTDGSMNRYKQDYNLNQGGYLPEFTLHYTPTEALKNLFDRLDINVRNLGNQPFQTFDVSLRKYNKYQFQWAHRKSTYFYSDDYEIGGGHLYDYHSFDFDRVSDSGSLKVRLGQNVQVYADFNSYTKQGASITTLDINRIEFEFDKPITEANREIAVGVDVNWKGWSLQFEERIQDYENDFGFFLPGYEDGGEGARYPSDLSFFTQNQPYEFKTYNHIFRLNARPIGGLLIKGVAHLSDMDMTLSYDEEAAGTDYNNRPFEYTSSGQGEFQRKMNLLDLDLTYLLSNKFALVGAIRNHDFKQEGFMTVDGDRMEQDFGYDTLGVDAGLQFQASPGVTVTGGFRFEERRLENLQTFLYEDQTRRNGLFGSLNWAVKRIFRLNLDYQYGDFKDPYTMISPSKFNRFRATARVNLKEVYFSGLLFYRGSKNDLLNGEPWESTRLHLNFRAGYQGKTLSLYAGYGYIEQKHQADRTVAYPPGWSGPGGTFMWPIDYEGKSNILDVSIKFNISELGRIGAYGNLYWNRGFWTIDRNLIKAYLQYDFPYGMFGEVAYRYIKFEEEMSGFNDYSANILELNFGYKWQ